MNYLEKIQDLYAMIESGKLLEAFDKYYHEDIVMIEATGEVREGKEFNREHEEKHMAGIKEFHGFGVYGITSNEEEGITMVESWMDVTMAEGGYRMKMEEVAVQHWEDDLIIRERFYYNVPK